MPFLPTRPAGGDCSWRLMSKVPQRSRTSSQLAHLGGARARATATARATARAKVRARARVRARNRARAGL